MLANLSFRTKLLSLLIAVILGFLIVTVVALQGLSAQETSSTRFEGLTKVDKDLSFLTITLMEEYEALSKIDDESYEAFLQNLTTSYEASLVNLAEGKNYLESQSAKDNLDNIATSLTQYNEALQALVQKRQTDRKSVV